MNKHHAGEAVYRAVAALVMGNVRPEGEARFLKRFPDDGLALATETVLKAATTPGKIGDAGLGGVLAEAALRDFFASLGPVSAASQLMALSLNLGLPDGINNFTVPALVAQPIAGAFVKEGDPGRVRSHSLLGPSVTPKKMLILSAITRELAKRMGAEELVRRILRRDAGLSFDAALFSDDAETDAAPAGLLYGVTPLTSYGGTDDEAMRQDLKTLANAVAGIASGKIVFVASPDIAVSIALASRAVPYPVYSTSALAAGTVAAIAPDALTFAVEPSPDITVSSEAAMHMEDETPLPIVAANGTTAAPVRSMFQTDCVAIRLIADMTWTKLHDDAVAVVTGAGW